MTTTKPSDDLLFEYALGALDDPGRAREKAGIEAALAADPRLRQTLEEIELVVRHLPDAGAGVEPGVGFDTRLYAQLDAIDAQTAPSWWSRLLPGTLSAVGLAAAAVLMVWAVPNPAPHAPLPAEPALLAELELLEDLDAVELVDVVDDLEAIESLEVEGS